MVAVVSSASAPLEVRISDLTDLYKTSNCYYGLVENLLKCVFIMISSVMYMSQPSYWIVNFEIRFRPGSAHLQASQLTMQLLGPC